MFFSPSPLNSKNVPTLPGPPFSRSYFLKFSLSLILSPKLSTSIIHSYRNFFHNLKYKKNYAMFSTCSSLASSAI